MAFLDYVEIIILTLGTFSFFGLGQQSSSFKVIKQQQIPTSGVTILKTVTTKSAVSCGNLCISFDREACNGFTFQMASCGATYVDTSGTCQLMNFTNFLAISFGPSANACHRFYTRGPILRPSLTYVIPSNESVSALALYRDQLFVTRKPKSTNQVEVYNTTTFQRIRCVTVSGASGSLFGLAIDTTSTFLYVTDNNNSAIYRTSLSTTTVSNYPAGLFGTSGGGGKWTAVKSPVGLAINRANNILVAGFSTMIQEYKLTNLASFVRNVTDSNNLHHVVEVSNGTLAVTRAGPVHGVCLIDVTNGTVLRSYGSTIPGSGFGQMNNPYGLAADSQGYLLVADTSNDRILILNPTLSDSRTLSLPVSLTSPIGVWLDESRGRLYVGEADGGNRLMAFDNVFNVSTAFLV